MEKIVNGVLRFQEDVYPIHQELFEKLASGQAPEALLVACADSRVDPGLITQAKPGDLFITRNAGNIVPPHDNHTGGTTASIEFAVGALNVKHIIILGHTDCGAMKGALAPESLGAFPHVSNWLAHARSAVQVVRAKIAKGLIEEEEGLHAVIEENVVQQMQHIRTHPYVASKIATDEIALHGWVYDIESGNVLAYDEQKREFSPIDQKYTKDVLRMLGDHAHDNAAA